MSATCLEVALQYAAANSRAFHGAYSVQVWDSGTVDIQGLAADVAHIVDDLSLAYESSHGTGNNTYAIYTGVGRGLFSDVKIRLAAVSAILADEVAS